MINDGSGGGAGGEGNAPLPNPTELDTAGLAVEMMNALPSLNLLPLLVFNLQNQVKQLQHEINELKSK